MIHRTKALVALAVVALAVAPAMALASSQTAPPGHGQGHHGKPVGSPGNGPGGTTGNTGTTGTTGNSGHHGKPYGIKPHGHAYGFFCRGESKTHVAGTKGTPFSQCVTAMAHLATHQTTNPAKACKALSKKHVAGTPGTPFSKCVSAGNKLLK
jgi:hypothetical protein